MKLSKLFPVIAVLASMTLAAGKSMASPNEVNFSGSILEQNATTTKKDTESSTVHNVQLNDKFVYQLITNAVASAGTNGTGLTSTNFPANGYIAFDAAGDDGMVGGTFYVTNKSGFFFPLSGFDTNDNYYSFIELNAYNNVATDTAGLVNFGFSANFNGVEDENYNTSTQSGNVSVTSSGVLYIHDNPYSFNDGDNANVFYGNNNALEIRGQVEVHITYKSGQVKTWNFTVQGQGNAIVNNTQNSIVSNGKATASN